MGRRLTDNVTSKYIEAANRLNSRQARRKIVAYVESYDDIFFWRTILGRFEDQTRYFEIMLPTRANHLERGKKAAIMSLINGGKTGRDMIACVDADYDFLIQGCTPTSKAILGNPFVFHTYAYAIENMQCYAPTLHDICVAVTLNDDRTVFDFEAYLREFSLAIFPLFVWNIWFYRSPRYTQFTITDFLRCISLSHFNLEHPEASLASLRQKVAKKVRMLQRSNPNAKESYLKVKDDIKNLGVDPAETYMYIQGHHLFDSVVSPIMKQVCQRLIRSRQTEISRQSMHSEQCRNELSCYTSSIADADFMLKKSVGYLTSAQCRSIMADLQRYIDGTKGTGQLAESSPAVMPSLSQSMP